MAYDNQKYTDYVNIIARLSRKIRTKSFDPDDVLEWCQEVETDFLGDVDNMFRYLQVPLHVNNHLALLPCNVYRLLEVYTNPDDNNSQVHFYNDGAYLNLGTDYEKTYVYVNYFGTPIDETTGIPLIIKGHEKACEAYCIKQSYYEDILNEKINGNTVVWIEQEFANACNLAKISFRHISKQDLDKTVIIRHSMITKIGNMALFQKLYE